MGTPKPRIQGEQNLLNKNFSKKVVPNKFLSRKMFVNLFSLNTRYSPDLEAATMYKLKGQSSNMQTGQSFKNNKLVRLALLCLADQSNWHYAQCTTHYALCTLHYAHCAMHIVPRGQTDTDNPAEYVFIRNRIVPLGLKRIVI